MNNQPLPLMDSPAVYRIEVAGCPSAAWLASSWGSEVVVEECQENSDHRVVIVGTSDQAALVGCINALYNFGYGIVSLEIVEKKSTGGGNEDTLA